MSGPTVFGLCAAVAVGLGLYGLITNPHPLRKIIAFNLLGSGVFLLFGAVGRRGAAAGIGNDPVHKPRHLDFQMRALDRHLGTPQALLRIEKVADRRRALALQFQPEGQLAAGQRQHDPIVAERDAREFGGARRECEKECGKEQRAGAKCGFCVHAHNDTRATARWKVHGMIAP